MVSVPLDLIRLLSDCVWHSKITATAKNQRFVESIMRVVATEMGSCAALCLPPLDMRDARDWGVTRSLSQAWRIGRAIAICRQSKYEFYCDAGSQLKKKTISFLGLI